MDAIADPYHPINTNLDLTEKSREDAVSRGFIFVSKATVDAEEAECSICRVAFKGFTKAHPCPEETNERPVRLACGHIFGQLCIMEWLGGQSTCPKCRHEVLPFTPAQKEQIQYSLLHFILESWQRDRALYLEKLEAGLPSSSNALLFLQKYTTVQTAPNPLLEWATTVIVERPELLQDDQYRAARYFMGFAGRNLPMFHQILVKFILSDLRDEKALRDTGL